MRMTESFLQYVWQHQLLEGALSASDGQQVEIERSGTPNSDAGPDFFNARVRIGDTMWAGNVEVHVKSSDWNLHRHSNDRAYDNVVLHVVYDDDQPVTLQNCRQLPTLSLRGHIIQAVWDNYEALMDPPAPRPIPCCDHLAAVPQIYIAPALERLAAERLEAKCLRVRQMLEECRGGWEQVCWRMLAHYFGGRVNAFPFELLAKSVDPKLLARWRDNPERVEALLMGQAGLLEGTFDDDYPRGLQCDYEALRRGARLTPISGHLWKFFRLRPNGFPTIRISQYARLVCQVENLFGKLLETSDADQLCRFFDVTAAPYWTDHYRFDQPARAQEKRVGAELASLLVINAWVPLLFEYGSQHGSEACREQALELLQQMKPENNHIIREWRQAGLDPRDALQSQALIQLYTEHCGNRDCLRCPIGYKILQK